MGSQKVSRIVVTVDRLESIARALDQAHGLDGVIEAFAPAALEKARDTVDRVAVQPALEELRRYPPRKLGMRIRWKSERQRRYVLMMLRATNNLPYKRTGALGRGWKGDVKVDRRSGGLRVRIWNDAEQAEWRTGVKRRYERYVQGDVGLGVSRQSVARYDEAIQPFHKDRGWQPAAQVIQRAFARAARTALQSTGGSFGAEVQKAMRR